MSFGYSVSDLVSTAALAWKIYKTCKDSSGEFKNISSEVITLHIVLKEVQDSLTCQQLNQRQEAELESVGKGCNDVLKDLDKLLKKYGSLGTSKSSRVWDRMKWGLEDVKTMRDRLISNTTMLSAFNAALIHFSQARIEDKLNELIAGIRDGRRASTISSHTLDSLSADDRNSWRQLRKDLQDIGISVPILKQHQRFIIAWLEEAVRLGALEGVNDDGQMDDLRISIIDVTEDTASQCLAEASMLPEHGGRLPSTIANRRSRRSPRSSLTPAINNLTSSDFESLPCAVIHGDVEWIKKNLSRGLAVDHRISDRRTMLHLAACYGHETLVKLLLEHRAQNTAKDKFGLTALHLAASRPYCGVVHLLLDHKADVAAKDNQGSTALHIASKHAQREIVALLLNKGANIAAKDNGGETPLHSATFSGSVAVVLHLLRNGADVYEQDNTGQTALHRAAFYEQKPVAGVLLRQGANTETKDKYGRTALQLVPDKWSVHFPYAIPCQMALKMLLKPLGPHGLPRYVELGELQKVRELLNYGVDIDQHNYCGSTALHLAISTGQGYMVQLLLRWGANTEAKDREGNTALHLAVAIGREDIVNILLDKEANVEAKNANGDKVLHWAVFLRQEAIVSLLLTGRANPEARNNIQETALHSAILQGHDGIVQLLLLAGAEVNACFTEWGTPLHLAVRCKYYSIVQLLLSGGADTNAKDPLGRTPLHTAASAASLAIADLLLIGEADVAAIDINGQTALHEAAMWGNEAVVQLLLVNGADVRAADIGGRTALHEAVMWGDEVVAQLLLDRGADIAAKTADGVTALESASTARNPGMKPLLESAAGSAR